MPVTQVCCAGQTPFTQTWKALSTPAKSVSPHAADSALVVVGIDTIKGKIYVRDVVSGKFHPNELVDA